MLEWLEWWPALFGWPAIIVSMGLAAAGIKLENLSCSLSPPCWWLRLAFTSAGLRVGLHLPAPLSCFHSLPVLMQSSVACFGSLGVHWPPLREWPFG